MSEKNGDLVLFSVDEPAKNSVSLFKGMNLSTHRKKLLTSYRQEKQSIMDKVKGSPSPVSSDALMNLLIEEILDETETLLGNSLVLTEDGNLHDATSVTVKRADLLKAIADIVAKKKELNQKDGDVDLNSPAFMIFQKLCFDKLMLVLDELGLDNELIQLILSKWAGCMKEWGREVMNELKEMKT